MNYGKGNRKSGTEKCIQFGTTNKYTFAVFTTTKQQVIDMKRIAKSTFPSKIVRKGKVSYLNVPATVVERMDLKEGEHLDVTVTLPETVDTADEAAFRERLLSSLERIARTENDRDPVHNYLIGLAYMEGIDVEVDRERGVELITSAAEADLPEAMYRLWSMYRSGKGVTLVVLIATTVALYLNL